MRALSFFYLTVLIGSIFFSCEQGNLENSTTQQIATEQSSTVRSNVVHFHAINMKNLKITPLGEYSITKGQPWKGVKEKVVSDQDFELEVQAGRVKSEQVSKWFREMIKDGFAVGCNTSASLPSKLNFAFNTKISFTYRDLGYVSNDVIIAQGNASSRNNWWIGGENLTRFKGYRDLPYLVEIECKSVSGEESISLVIEPKMSKILKPFEHFLVSVDHIDLHIRE